MNRHKSLTDLKTQYFNRLVELIDMGSDWETIIGCFPKVIDERLESAIRHNVTNSSPSKEVLLQLRNNLIPITSIYECFKLNNMEKCCEIIEAEFPTEADFIKNKHTLNRSAKQSRNQQPNVSPTPSTENQENIFKSPPDVNKNSSSHSQVMSPLNTNTNIDKDKEEKKHQTLKEQKQKNENESMGVNEWISMHEMILGVVFYEENNLKKNVRVFGKFEHCYIAERKLSFIKREINDSKEYLRELKCIQHRHLNILTADIPLQKSNSKAHYILYPFFDFNQTNLLKDYASIFSNLQPAQFKIHDQLNILRDIACGLAYLHEKMPLKNDMVLHGNLNSETILIIRSDSQKITAKIFDFSKSIEIDDNESESNIRAVRAEFYNFGLIIWNVLTWKNITKVECDKIYNAQKDTNLLSYVLFKEYHIDQHPYANHAKTLLRSFIRLTAPDYDINKIGYDVIKRFYDKINFIKNTLESEGLDSIRLFNATNDSRLLTIN